MSKKKTFKLLRRAGITLGISAFVLFGVSALTLIGRLAVLATVVMVAAIVCWAFATFVHGLIEREPSETKPEPVPPGTGWEEDGPSGY